MVVAVAVVATAEATDDVLPHFLVLSLQLLLTTATLISAAAAMSFLTLLLP